MKKRLRGVLLALNFAFACFTGTAEAAGLKGELELSNGYRVDNLDWNIAGDLSGRNPNVLSELVWSDLEIYQVKAATRVTAHEVFYLRGSLARGWIFDGSNQDSDFLGDNRTFEFSRSNNSSDAGKVWDASVGIGYIVPASERLRVIPLIGYSYNRQNLTLRDGVQTLSLPPSGQPLGPIPGLDSTYETEWWGPWIGLDLLFRATDKITLFSSIEYHRADYKAVADWNLRQDLLRFRSFEHDAEAKGFAVSLGAEYILKGSWCIGLNVNYREWSASAGTNRVFLADGDLAASRLNEVSWDSLAIFAGVAYRFSL
jgi:hypothetical protein